jgi:Zn-finger nucleic acid-binding protein
MLKLCPTCHRDLDEVERMGVLVDVCPRCQGVWLDRGELEKVSVYIRAIPASPGEERAASPRFVTVYETSVRRGLDKFQIRNLLDIFRNCSAIKT